jgi:hypothetical protein
VFLPMYPELPSQAFDIMAGLVNDCAAHVAAESVALWGVGIGNAHWKNSVGACSTYS